MTNTVSPLCVRQWTDDDNNNNNNNNNNSKDNSNALTKDDPTSRTLDFHVHAAQSLLLEQIVPTYATLTHHSLEATQLQLLLEQLQALATCLHIHLAQAIRNKILLNGRKYPVDQAKGKRFKYTEYSKTTGITKQQGQSTIHFPNVYTGQETTQTELRQLQTEIRDFAAQREWDPFHTPRNLCLALGGELGELVEQLCMETTLQKDKLYQEVADVTIYLLRLADVCQLPLFSSSTDATVLSLPPVQSQQTAPSESVFYPVGLIRNHILKLWSHWVQHDKELFVETLQHISTLLNRQDTTTSSTTTIGNHPTPSNQWIYILCLLGELSDQFQFLGDDDQPLQKYTVICEYIQQMMVYCNNTTNANETL